MRFIGSWACAIVLCKQCVFRMSNDLNTWYFHQHHCLRDITLFFIFFLERIIKGLRFFVCIQYLRVRFYLLFNTVWIRWYLPFLKHRIIQDICNSWLRFEREFGKLEDFDLALQKVYSFLFNVCLLKNVSL